MKVIFRKIVDLEKVCMKNYTNGNKEDEKKLEFLKHSIQLNYQHHWLVK